MQVFLWILAVLTTLAAGYFTWRADIRRGVPKPWLTAALRSLVMALVWLLLLAPSLHRSKEEVQQPVVVFLQDESASIPASLKGDTAKYRTQVNDLLKKLKQKYRVISWGFGANVQSDSLFHYHQSSTDISSALSRVQEFYGQQNLGAVIMATDGRFNQGSHPLFQDLGLRSPLYNIAIGDTALEKDLRITQVYANKTASVNSQFEIRADIIGARCNGYNGSAQLFEGTTTLQSTPISIAADKFDRSLSFTVKPTTPGLHHYSLLLPVADGEQNTANNRREIFVQVVEEKKNILILAAAPHPDVNAIREALTGLDMYNVTVKIGGANTPLDNQQIIILHGLPSLGGSFPAINKPVWYIVSGTTSNALSTTAATLAINPAAQQDAYPAINGSFSSFTLPAKLGLVLDKMPPLSAPMGNVQPGPNAQSLFTRKGSGNVPLWLVQSGATPQALLLGEGLWRWRLYEYRYFKNHDVVDECIRQTVSLLAANVHEHPFRAEQTKYEWSDGEPVTFNAYLLNASNEQINTPDASIIITDSAGKTRNFSFERNGSAYRLNTGIQPGGTYSYTAKTNYNGKAYTSSGSFVVAGVPLEMMQTGADFPMLYSLAKKYSGNVVTGASMSSVYDSLVANQNIKPVIQSHDESLPLVDWKWYFFLILAVASAEWLIRKYWLAQ